MNAGTPALVKQAGPGAGAGVGGDAWVRERGAGRQAALGGSLDTLGRRLRIFRLTGANILVFSRPVFLQLSSWVQLLLQRRPGNVLEESGAAAAE